MNRKTVVGIIFVVVLSLNLRPFLTSLTPMSAQLMVELGITYQQISFLAVVPMFLIGVLAFGGPRTLDRIGPLRSVVIASLLIAIGTAARLYSHTYEILVLTIILCSFGVALLQSVLPAIIRRSFPTQTALMTGVYSLALMGGGALGAAATAPLVEYTGSLNKGTSVWAFPAIFALIVAVIITPRRNERGKLAPINMWPLLRRPETLILIACFGLMNGGYAITVTWLANYYQTFGLSVAHTGNMLAVASILQAVSALVCPIIANNFRNKQRVFVAIMCVQLIGFIGIAIAPMSATYVWVMLLSLGLGGGFSVLILISLEMGSTLREGGYISAAMQGGGFMITAIAPWLSSVLIHKTGSFAAIWIYQAACIIVSVVISFWISKAILATTVSLVGRGCAERPEG